jgi:phosphoglycolate phosphatase
MKNRFDLLIFDWDGTLVDSVDWIVFCIQQAASRHQCPVPSVQAAKDIIGLSIDKAIQQLFPEHEDIIRQAIVADYARHFLAKQMDKTDLFPGVFDMLEQFKQQGLHLAIATGKNAPGLAKAVAATGVGHLISTSRCSDQTASKPNPLMLNEIISELGVDKRRTVMIGDSIHDLQMASNAGIAAIGVTCGAHSADVLQQYQPLMCVAYPTDLRDLF